MCLLHRAKRNERCTCAVVPGCRDHSDLLLEFVLARSWSRAACPEGCLLQRQPPLPKASRGGRLR